MIVQVVDLVKEYGSGIRAVDGLNLRVEEGEIFGLLGPNGAGKTTTVGILTTTVRPTSGTATVAGYDVVREPGAVKAVIGTVTQANTLDRSLAVRENLSFHGRYMGLSRQLARRRSEELVEQLGLTDHIDSAVAALSGGLAQRLMLARALVARPRLVFLDEPTNALDPLGCQDLWRIVESIQNDGVTILLTTHRLDEAERLCSRVGIMARGSLLAIDSPANLIRQGGETTIVRIEVDDLPRLIAAAAVAPLETNGATAAFAADDGQALAQELLACARSQKIAVLNISIGTSTLEATFIDLVNRAKARAEGGAPGPSLGR